MFAIRPIVASVDIPLDFRRLDRVAAAHKNKKNPKRRHSNESLSLLSGHDDDNRNSIACCCSTMIPSWMFWALQPVENDMEYLARSWCRFTVAVDEICRARTNTSRRQRRGGHAHREAVFCAAMYKTCAAFNDGTECVKVELIVASNSTTSNTTRTTVLPPQQCPSWRNRSNAATTTQPHEYALKVTCFQAIPPELKRVAFCAADIPALPPLPVQAVPVAAAATSSSTGTTSTNDTARLVDNNNDNDNDVDEHIPMVIPEIILEHRPPLGFWNGATTDGEAVPHDNDEPMPPPPLVLDVVPILDEDDDDDYYLVA